MVIATDSQPTGLAVRCLSLEMTNRVSSEPFINTNGGVRLNPDSLPASAGSPGVAFGPTESAFCSFAVAPNAVCSIATPFDGPSCGRTLTTPQLSPFVIPARLRAAAIFPCWLMCTVDAGGDPLDSLMTSGSEAAGTVSSLVCHAASSGCSNSSSDENGRTRIPGFFATVPLAKTVAPGLMMHSSMRVRRLSSIRWRARKTLTRGGILSRSAQVISAPYSWQRCGRRSNPALEGSTSNCPVESSTKNGRCRVSSATFFHSVVRPDLTCCQTVVESRRHSSPLMGAAIV